MKIKVDESIGVDVEIPDEVDLNGLNELLFKLNKINKTFQSPIILDDSKKRNTIIEGTWGWTEEQDVYLKLNYGKVSIEDLMAKFGKRDTTIQARASMLGVSKPRAITHWTEEETKKLKQSIGHMSVRDIARDLVMTPKRVHDKISHMRKAGEM